MRLESDLTTTIDLGALALAIGRLCAHEWVSLVVETPHSLDELWGAIARSREGVDGTDRLDWEAWTLLEMRSGWLTIGNDDPVYWAFRAPQGRHDGCVARLGVHRPAPYGPWWEVVLEGCWSAAKIRQITVAPYPARWMAQDPSRLGILGALYGEAMRSPEEKSSKAIAALFQAIEEYGHERFAPGALNLAASLSLDGLKGSGASLQMADLTLEDRREMMKALRKTERFLETQRINIPEPENHEPTNP